jgi:cellulose synthase/poly-beta-1,6-N-acetylglucosamine synthase-like glycosyltransferase
MKTMPFVSILIAVRNEERNLPRLLNSIENLAYPKENLEVIIANDESDDNSLEILNQFASSKPWINIIDLSEIESNIDFPKGKMRALALIEKQAKGDYLLFTDADIALPSTWINSMLNGFESNIGILNGITGVQNTGFWAKMQNMEWLYALYIMHLNAKWGVPTTGMGNNMAISRAAFDSVGGFSGVGFSVVEDYAIFKAVLNKGFGFKQLYNTEVLAETLSAENYLEQRRRWMKGAFSSDSYLLYLSIFQAFSVPLLFILAIYFPFICLGLIALQIGIISYIALRIRQLIAVKFNILENICFGFYISISSLVQLTYYFLGKNIIWKGRTYIK